MQQNNLNTFSLQKRKDPSYQSVHTKSNVSTKQALSELTVLHRPK